MNCINKERLLNTFLELVSIDNETYHEKEIADYLKNIIEQCGLEYYEDHAGENLEKLNQDSIETYEYANNIYVTLKGNLPDEKMNLYKAILFSAHMDAVHPANHKKVIVHEDGMITSDGNTVLASDDLSGLAELLEIIRIFTENDIPHPDMEFLFTVAEETFCQGSKLVEYDKIKSKIAYVLDLSGHIGRAAYAAPSIYSIYIDIQGKAAHAGSAPEKGVNALAIAAHALSKIPFGKVDEDTTINIGTIQGGTGKNIVPENVIMSGEIRSSHEEHLLEWLRKIEQIFSDSADLYGGRVKFDAVREIKAYEIASEEPVYQLFVSAMEDLSLETEIVRTYGGSDCNHFCEHGIRGLVLANGMYEIHSLKEYSRVQDLEQVCQILLKIIENR